jgi:hypothetical protein
LTFSVSTRNNLFTRQLLSSQVSNLHESNFLARPYFHCDLISGSKNATILHRCFLSLRPNVPSSVPSSGHSARAQLIPSTSLSLSLSLCRHLSPHPPLLGSGRLCRAFLAEQSNGQINPIPIDLIILLERTPPKHLCSLSKAAFRNCRTLPHPSVDRLQLDPGSVSIALFYFELNCRKLKRFTMAARSAEILKSSADFVRNPHHSGRNAFVLDHRPSFGPFDKRRQFDLKPNSAYRRHLPNPMHPFVGPPCPPHFAASVTSLNHPHLIPIPFHLTNRRRFFKSESADPITREPKKCTKHVSSDEKVVCERPSIEHESMLI